MVWVRIDVYSFGSVSSFYRRGSSMLVTCRLDPKLGARQTVILACHGTEVSGPKLLSVGREG